MDGWKKQLKGIMAGYNLDRLPDYCRADTHRDRQPFTLTFTPTGNLESRINLTCMSSDCGRKPEYPVRIYASTGRTCKSYEKQAWLATVARQRHLVKVKNGSCWIHRSIIPGEAWLYRN